MITNQFLLISSGFIVGSYACIDAANNAVRERWRRNGFKSSFDVVDRFNEPGAVAPIPHHETGEPIGFKWVPE